MRSLEDFPGEGGEALFPDAQQLPDFFEHNLVDPARVVKGFLNDPQANIRVFYYQYLKLCFQLENVDFEGYIGKIEQIINNEDFKFVFYEDDDPSVFSDLQFKQLLTQFFGLLGDNVGTVEQLLTKYPIMDTVLIYFFRAILILTGKTDSLDSYIEREELFQYLCNYFGVDISTHDKCIKFVETDIFVYEQKPEAVFMAYMDYDRLPNQPSYSDNNNENTIENPGNAHQGSILEKKYKEKSDPSQSSNNVREGTEVNQSYISSQFVDYTNQNSTNLTNLVKPSNLKHSGTIQRPEPVPNSIFLSSNIEKSIPIQTQSFPDVLSKVDPPKPQPSKIEPSRPSYTDTFTYSSQSNSYGLGSLSEKSGPQNTTGLNHFQSKFTVNQVQNTKKVEENKYQSDFKWQPTKDPGFSPANPPYVPTSTYEKSLPNIDNKIPLNQALPSYQPPAVDTNRTKQSSYTSSASASNNLIDFKPPSSQSPKEVFPIPSSQPSYQTAAGVTSSGKHPWNINVSLEFTNSFTMKAMAEPFKSNVRSIRQKARTYRDSLSSFIK